MSRFFDALQRSQAERSGVDVSDLPGATEAKEGAGREDGLEWEAALKGHGKNIAQVYSENIEAPGATELPRATELKENVEQDAALQRKTARRDLDKNIAQVDPGNNGSAGASELPHAIELKESAGQEAALKWGTALRRLDKDTAQVDSGDNGSPGATELKESVEQESALEQETTRRHHGKKTARVDSGNHALPSTAIQASASVRTAPTITWPTPGLITYGNKLTIAQLNATASVEGTFAYTPGPGEVLPAGAHTLRVTFTPADSGGHAPLQAAVSIVVAKATPALSWPTPAGIICGNTLSDAQLNASASVSGKFDYSPAPGEVLPPGMHTLSVTFTPEDSANCAAAHASVSLFVAQATSVVQWPTPDPISYGTPLSATQLCAAASVPGTFEYDPGLGAVLAAGEHKLSVVFTPTDSLGYSASQTATSLTVAQATSVIQWLTPDPITYGTALSDAQLCAVASVPGTFEYDPGLGAVLGAGEHKLSVVFTPEDGLGYSTSQTATSVTVAKATPAITWPTPDPITYGTLLSDAQLCAVAPVPGTFEYDPAPGTLLAAGEHKLSVVFTPEDTLNYSTSQIAASVTVAQATPDITWPAPDPIVHGAGVSTTQLNATATVPGSFVYTPAAGEILEPGVHEVSVVFTPIDNLNYTTARAVAPLTISKKLRTVTLRREVDKPLFQSFTPKKVEVKREQKTARKKWTIVAAVSAFLILIVLIFLIALFYRGTESVAKPSVQPLPEAGDTQPTTNTPEPPAREPLTQTKPPAKIEKQKAADNQPAKREDGVMPVQAPTNTTNDPLAAPTRIPKQTAENTPPPANDTAGAEGLGGGGANVSIFNGQAQLTVKVASSKPVAISSGVATGMLIQSTPPVYPPLARTAHVAGTVELHATISANGTIKDLRAVNGPAMLRQAAVDAVRNWRYKPYKLNDQPVEVETTINVVFTLGG
jgi:TonB family protein